MCSCVIDFHGTELHQNLLIGVRMTMAWRWHKCVQKQWQEEFKYQSERSRKLTWYLLHGRLQYYLWKIAWLARNFISENNMSCKRELLLQSQNYFPTTFGFSFTYGDVHIAVFWLGNWVYRMFVKSVFLEYYYFYCYLAQADEGANVKVLVLCALAPDVLKLC